jgi:hypothetical protein
MQTIGANLILRMQGPLSLWLSKSGIRFPDYFPRNDAPCRVGRGESSHFRMAVVPACRLLVRMSDAA